MARERKTQRVELLAPAGNTEGFYGAIHAGADAVYLGGTKFGARAYADNFTTEELCTCIRYAHIWGRKVYLTVNTLMKDTELAELLSYLSPFYEAGLDGVIVQDIGVFCYIREHFPNLELHVSTQMTITGKYGARRLGQMGASRIVPARELSLEEIKELKTQSGLEVECFIHGAMCYCYSGQCLFSSILGGRSGNRGKCAQPCRLPYHVEIDGKASSECYPLSLKDMCTIEHIPELITAGIDSFKIEGRMKKPEYAAGVTAIYRKYIDRYYAGEDCHVAQADLRELNSLYIRSERQNGYYFRHNGKDMVTIKDPSYSNTDDALVKVIHDKYIETKPKIPVSVRGEFHKGSPAKLIWSLITNEALHITVAGEIVSPAIKQPVTEENIRRQLGKLGDTLFVVEEMQIDLEPDCFYPLKSLNEMRRQAVHKLEDQMILQYGLCPGRGGTDNLEQTPKTQRFSESHTASANVPSTLHILARTVGQLEGILGVLSNGFSHTPANNNVFPVNRLYLEGDLVCQIFNVEQYAQLKGRLIDYLYRQKHCKLVLALPQILRKRDETFLSRIKDLLCREDMNLFSGFLVRSMDDMGVVHELMDILPDRTFSIYTDAGFYIWNTQSVKAFDTDGFCLPYELRAGDQRRLMQNCLAESPEQKRCEKLVYGYIPLMHTANCVYRTMDQCRQKQAMTDSSPAYLTDRYKKRFPVVADCGHCMNIIYNCLPLSLHGELSKWQGRVDFRVDFSIEDKAQTELVLRYFMSGCTLDRPYAESTSGHEKRGAE